MGTALGMPPVGHVQSIDEFIAPLDDNRASIATSVFNSIGGDIEGGSGNPGYSSERGGGSLP